MNERSFIVKRSILTPARRGGLLRSVPKRLRQNSDWNTEILRRFPADQRYLIGVSGGRDSVALLHWLVREGYQRLLVCHLDHRLRGRSAAADARFVERLADDLGLVFVGAEKDVRLLARDSKQSIETAARAARYAFFAAVARRRRCRTIFLGHHADDLVETFLMNLFRGTGAEGSRSIQGVSVHAVGETELTVVRPLLGVWRAEIDEYVAGAKLRFREDASNATLESTRNRMRHQIIPFLEKEFGRGIRKAVWRAAAIAAEEDALLESLLPPELRARETLPVAQLRSQPIAWQRRAIRSWLRAHAVADVGFDLIENIRRLLETDARSAKINLPGDRHARRRAGKLFLE
jgi:tRNA(Ile)-lysidine synthase